MSMQELILLRTFHRAVEGDVRAVRLVLEWLDKHQIGEPPPGESGTLPQVMVIIPPQRAR